MPIVRLRQILKDSGTKQVRSMMKKTGSNSTSVFRQAQIAGINAFYTKSGGFRGPFSFPLEEVQFKGNQGAQRLAGGTITWPVDGPQGQDRHVVQVRYLGFHCDQESSWDQSTGSDEPYFMISVLGSNKSITKRFGPYEDIDSGTVRTETSDVATVGIDPSGDNVTAPMYLAVAAMEHDWGSPQEAEGKVRSAIEDAESVLDSLAAFMGANTKDNHVMPDWVRNIYIGWFPEWGTALFGLADDDVGKNAQALFDYKQDLLAWPQPPVKGKWGDNDYTHTLSIDGGSQGKYTLYFYIQLFQIIFVPEQPGNG
jgi:hypothetical protein